MRNTILKVLLALSLICLPAYATVTTNTSKVIYNGTGNVTGYPFTFPIYNTTDLVVQELNTTTGNITTLTLATDYNVTLTNSSTPNNGTVNMSAAPDNTTQLIILRSIPYTQQISLSDNEVTPAATYEEGFDRSAMLAQQLQEQVSRSILQDPTANTTITLPTPSAGKILQWSNTTGTLQNTDLLAGPAGPQGPSGSAGNPAGNVTEMQFNGGSQFISDPTFTYNSTTKNLTVVNVIVGNITNSGLTASRYVKTDANKMLVSCSTINASDLASLDSIGAGAGTIPVANLPTGSTANKVVVLDANASLPAVDGSKLSGVSASIVNKQFFTTNGTFTAGTGVTRVYLTMVAGGGGGGGWTLYDTGAGGGGGGAAVVHYPYTVTAGNNYTVTILGAGVGGVNATNGTDGGNVSFGTGTVITVLGGKGGHYVANNTTGGNGGGTPSDYLGTALVGIVGENGQGSSTGAYSGNGGGSIMGHAGAGVNGTNGSGSAATGYGAGGGGGYSKVFYNASGGNGTKGAVLVEW